MRRTTACAEGEESAGQCGGGHASGFSAHPSANDSTGGVSLGRLASPAAVISTPARRAAASTPYGGSVAEKRSVAMPLTIPASSQCVPLSLPRWARLIWPAATAWLLSRGAASGCVVVMVRELLPAGADGCRDRARRDRCDGSAGGAELTWQCDEGAPSELGRWAGGRHVRRQGLAAPCLSQCGAASSATHTDTARLREHQAGANTGAFVSAGGSAVRS